MRANSGLVGLIAAALLVSGANAAENDFVARFMGAPPGKTKTYACFNRVYDPAHLGAHPQQNVKTMALLAIADPDDADSIGLRIGVTFRTRNGTLETEGSCYTGHLEGETADPSGLHCSVACDGGAFELSLRTDGAVRLGIPEGARLWKPGSDDPSGNVHGAFGPDDKVFRLDRAALRECAPLGADKEEKARLSRAR